MPLVDLSLPDLRKYSGRNPRPSDFDTYWTTALQELATIDPEPTLTRTSAIAPRGTECFDLWFTGIGGAKIYAKYLRPKWAPKNDAARYPALLQFHGYAGHSGDWAEKLVWPTEGFCLAAMDCRGQGGRSEDNGRRKGTSLRGHIIRGLDDPDPDKLAFRQIFLDTVQLARVIMKFEEVDAARIGCFGGSQGGALTLACAALEPRIRRAAAGYPFLCDYQRVWEMDLGRDAYEELRYYFRMNDPRHERASEIFSKLGYIDCQHLASRIQAEVLMFTGLMDTVCPPSTQFAAFNKISAPKDVVIYPDFGHEALPGQSDHMLKFFQQM